MAKTCGSCNLQGGSKIDENRHIKILCLYDNKEHRDSDTCNQWQPHISGISIEVRRQTASDIRNREDSERRHKENLKSAELDRNAQLKRDVIFFFLGIAATLLTQWIISLWK